MNRQLETGINLGWTAQSNATNFGIGCKYAIDRDTNLRAKVSNSSQLGLGFQHRLREGESSLPDRLFFYFIDWWLDNVARH